MKIAIIGSGIAGLATAWLLRQHYEICLFEQNDYFGGHCNTASIDYAGSNINVDTGFIVFNHRTYHHLSHFFRHLEVATHASNMSFGIKDYSTGLEYSGNNLLSLFAQKRNLVKPAYWRMLMDILRFNKHAICAVETQSIAPNTTLLQFIDQLRLGDYFKRYYLLPMGGAIWSCPVELMHSYPAQTFLQFFYNHGLLTVTDQPQWYTVTGGSKNYVNKVLSQLPAGSYHKRAVTQVCAKDGQVEVCSTGGRQTFDRVVFACHADQALSLINNPQPQQRQLLEKFHFSKNHAVLHHDTQQMPQQKRAWASWVYLSDTQQQQASLTYWMNNLQGIEAQKPLFVTLNPLRDINPSCVFAQYTYEHPIFNQAAIIAQQQLPSIQGMDNLWFAGAWTRYGFHEDGILSAIKVAEDFGVSPPWSAKIRSD